MRRSRAFAVVLLLAGCEGDGSTEPAAGDGGSGAADFRCPRCADVGECRSGLDCGRPLGALVPDERRALCAWLAEAIAPCAEGGVDVEGCVDAWSAVASGCEATVADFECCLGCDDCVDCTRLERRCPDLVGTCTDLPDGGTTCE